MPVEAKGDVPAVDLDVLDVIIEPVDARSGAHDGIAPTVQSGHRHREWVCHISLGDGTLDVIEVDALLDVVRCCGGVLRAADDGARQRDDLADALRDLTRDFPGDELVEVLVYEMNVVLFL